MKDKAMDLIKDYVSELYDDYGLTVCDGDGELIVEAYDKRNIGSYVTFTVSDTGEINILEHLEDGVEVN